MASDHDARQIAEQRVVRLQIRSDVTPDNRVEKHMARYIVGHASGEALVELITKAILESRGAQPTAEGENPWKDAIIDAAVVSWTYQKAHEDDPRAAVGALLAQAQQEALDPAISADAQALIQRGDAEGYARGKAEGEREIALLQRQLDAVDALVGFPDGSGCGRIEMIQARRAEGKAEGLREAVSALQGESNRWTQYAARWLRQRAEGQAQP